MSSETSSSQHNNQNPNPETTNALNIQSGRKLIIILLLPLILGILIALLCTSETTNLFAFRRLFGSSTAARSATGPPSLSASASIAAVTSAAALKGKTSSTDNQTSFKMKTPIYFLSHGGVSYLTVWHLDIECTFCFLYTQCNFTSQIPLLCDYLVVESKCIC